MCGVNPLAMKRGQILSSVSVARHARVLLNTYILCVSHLKEVLARLLHVQVVTASGRRDGRPHRSQFPNAFIFMVPGKRCFILDVHVCTKETARKLAQRSCKEASKKPQIYKDSACMFYIKMISSLDFVKGFE